MTAIPPNHPQLARESHPIIASTGIPQSVLDEASANLEGKSTFEAMCIKAGIPDANRADVKVTNLETKYTTNNQDEVIAGVHIGNDGKKYFKFDVEWKATVEKDGVSTNVEFKQTIFTSIAIPTGKEATSETMAAFNSAKESALQLVSSYALIQKQMTIIPADIANPGIKAQFEAIKTSNVIHYKLNSQNIQQLQIHAGNTNVTPFLNTAFKTDEVAKSIIFERKAPKKTIRIEADDIPLAVYEKMERLGKKVSDLNDDLKTNYNNYLNIQVKDVSEKFLKAPPGAEKKVLGKQYTSLTSLGGQTAEQIGLIASVTRGKKDLETGLTSYTFSKDSHNALTLQLLLNQAVAVRLLIPDGGRGTPGATKGTPYVAQNKGTEKSLVNEQCYTLENVGEAIDNFNAINSERSDANKATKLFIPFVASGNIDHMVMAVVEFDKQQKAHLTIINPMGDPTDYSTQEKQLEQKIIAKLKTEGKTVSDKVVYNKVQQQQDGYTCGYQFVYNIATLHDKPNVQKFIEEKGLFLRTPEMFDAHLNQPGGDINKVIYGKSYSAPTNPQPSLNPNPQTNL
jgi:hypothetical protein